MVNLISLVDTGTTAGLLIIYAESWTLLSCQGLRSSDLIIRVCFIPYVTLSDQSIHSTMVRLMGPSNQPHISRHLKSYPVISMDPEAFNLVMNDNCIGLRELFAAGTLSPASICPDGEHLLSRGLDNMSYKILCDNKGFSLLY